ncbi:MAG: hypothetical protein ABJG50_12505 [Crocinitomicaceae bacterium]
MGKTSYNNMKELSDAISSKIGDLESGELAITDLEGLVEEARELYERLLIVKFKAYEKYGEPSSESSDHEEEAEEVNEIVEEIETEEEETGFDFSGITEEVEQPSFDFSGSIEAESSATLEAEEKAEVQEEEEQVQETQVAEESEETKEVAEDIFKDSHVERIEAEDENSLNEKLKDSEDELSLRKKLQSTPVTDLRKEISIAKKFEYITFMFEGRNETYEKAIDSLNNCADGEEAKNKLNEFSTQYNWDLENKSIIKFVELVERRYL